MTEQKQTPNVEFGSELGDINAAKNYEIPLMNKGKKTKDKKNVTKSKKK